jgi:hypothetical protein
MGFVMMPSMTAGLNAVPMHLMSRASSMSNVMRQVFGAFGTAVVVTVLQLRQTYHTAMLAQTVTPENLPLQRLMSMAQQMAASHGFSSLQSQAMALMMAGQQVALGAAVMAFDDVFRVTAAVTLLAIPPALFMRRPQATGHRGPTIIAD